jgi:hypothetical protein
MEGEEGTQKGSAKVMRSNIKGAKHIVVLDQVPRKMNWSGKLGATNDWQKVPGVLSSVFDALARADGSLFSSPVDCQKRDLLLQQIGEGKAPVLTDVDKATLGDVALYIMSQAKDQIARLSWRRYPEGEWGVDWLAAQVKELPLGLQEALSALVRLWSPEYEGHEKAVQCVLAELFPVKNKSCQSEIEQGEEKHVVDMLIRRMDTIFPSD